MSRRKPRRHEWVPGNEVIRWPHCRPCGIIRRADGKNSAECKGPPRITTRRKPARKPDPARGMVRVVNTVTESSVRVYRGPRLKWQLVHALVPGGALNGLELELVRVSIRDAIRHAVERARARGGR